MDQQIEEYRIAASSQNFDALCYLEQALIEDEAHERETVRELTYGELS